MGVPLLQRGPHQGGRSSVDGQPRRTCHPSYEGNPRSQGEKGNCFVEGPSPSFGAARQRWAPMLEFLMLRGETMCRNRGGLQACGAVEALRCGEALESRGDY